MAEARIRSLQLDPKQKAGKLSGGQRAQLALTLVAAKRPELLLLDEPVAALDPLARRAFLQSLMELVAELEARSCSPLTCWPTSSGSPTTSSCSRLVTSSSPARSTTLLATHVRTVGINGEFDDPPPGFEIVSASHTARQTTVVARVPAASPHPFAEAERLDLEDLVLAYMTKAAEESVLGVRPVADLEVQR